MKLCKVNGCGKQIDCEGFCWKHFHRNRKYGDPLAGPAYYGNLTDKERFMKYVDQNAPNNCWHWLGGMAGAYGRFRMGQKNVPAHRAAVALFHDAPKMDGLLACHRCDNPLCVNPDHLFMGTVQDNIDDKMAKGRHNPSRGEDSGHAKLTETDVLQIRESNKNTSELSIEYKVSLATIKYIRAGKRWKHVGGPIRVIEKHTSGENHPMSKLNEDKVRYIRTSGKTTRALSEELGVSIMSVHEAKTGKTWKHVI